MLYSGGKRVRRRDAVLVQAGVSYFSGRDLRHVRQDLADMVEHGCSYVVHCLTETDLLWYRGTMKEIAAATRDAGMEVWTDPWGVGAVYSGETLTEFPARHPEALQVLSDGSTVPAGCPNHPETRQLFREWLECAAEIGTDVVFWDEPHFYSTVAHFDFSGRWACRCGCCTAAFREWAGKEMPLELTREVLQFRERSLLDLLTEGAAAARGMGLRNALCLIPTDYAAVGLDELAAKVRGWWAKLGAKFPPDIDNPWIEWGITDWTSAAAIPDLDIFGCDPYWYALQTDVTSLVPNFSREAIRVARAAGRQSQIWVQAFSAPAGREEEMRTAVEIAAAEGADYIAAWSYAGTGSMSRIRCERPEVAWQVLGEAFRALPRPEAERAPTDE